MPKAHVIQTNFTSGEFSPFLHGRVDIQRYANAADTLSNFIIRPQGGLSRRSGTRYVGSVDDATKKSRLIPFIVAEDTTYILEFAEDEIVVYSDGAKVTLDTDLTIANFPSISYTEAEIPNISVAQSADVLYIAHEAHAPAKLSRTSHTAWTFADVDFSDGPYGDVNVDPSIKVSVVMPYTAKSIYGPITITSSVSDFVVGDEGKFMEIEDKGEIKFGIVPVGGYTDANTLTFYPLIPIVSELPPEVTFVSETAGPYTVTVSHDTFTRRTVGHRLKVIDDGTASVVTAGWYLITEYDGANRDQAISSTGIISQVVPAASGAGVYTNFTYNYDDIVVTLTATANVWDANDVGTSFRVKFGDETRWVKITAYSSETSVTGTIDDVPPADPNETTLTSADRNGYLQNGETTEWRLSAWSATRGWPSIVMFHEQRLVFAASTQKPNTLWFSKSADFENFAPTEPDLLVLDNSAITATLASGRINKIEWMVSGPTMMVGTTGDEWQIKAASQSEPLTPTSLKATTQTSLGSDALALPVRVGSSVLFIQRSGVRLAELLYNFEIQGYDSRDLSIIAEHIMREGDYAIAMAYQQEPYNVLWILLNDGTLAGFTYNRDQEIFAFHRHTIADGVVASIAVVPDSTSKQDLLYMVVNRTIDGNTTRYIEYLLPDFYPISTTDKDDMCFLDSSLVYDSTPATVITGLTHLEGETVTPVGDGSVQPDKVVASGQITLDYAASKVFVGLPYTSTLVTLPPEGGNPTGTSQGQTKRIHEVVFRVWNSIGFKFGPDTDTLNEWSARDANDPMDVSPPFFTGDVVRKPKFSYDTRSQMTVLVDQPYPLNLIAIVQEMVVNG